MPRPAINSDRRAGWARSARIAAIVGCGCLASAVASGSALAPVGSAQASIEAAATAPPATALPVERVELALPLPDAPGPLALLEEMEAEAEAFLRVGAHTVPRSLVGAIVRAAARTGVDPVYLLALADKESSFRANARASTSSAEGLFQFIDRTWLDVVRRFGERHGLSAEAASVTLDGDRPVVADEAVRAAILDLRRDPYLSAAMAAELLKRDAALIGFRLGRGLTRAELYLAHFLGLADAARFLELRDGKRPPSAAKLFPAAARANASIFFERKRRGRRGLSLPEVFARIDRMIETRAVRYEGVTAALTAGS